MTLTDILDKIGGAQGQQGGLDAISQLFGGDDLKGILARLQRNGMDKQVKSWLGNGKNLPVTGADIKRVVDPAILMSMAKRQGMTPDEMCEHIAMAMPNLVDKATPKGQVPAQGGMTALLGVLDKR